MNIDGMDGTIAIGQYRSTPPACTHLGTDLGGIWKPAQDKKLVSVFGEVESFQTDLTPAPLQMG